MQQLPGFILGAGVDLRRQVAIGHLAGNVHGRAQGAHDAHRQQPGAHDAKAQRQHGQGQQQVAARLGDLVDLARGFIDAGALVLQHVVDHFQVFRRTGHEDPTESLLRFRFLSIRLQLRHLRTRIEVDLALFAHQAKQLLFFRAGNQGFDLLLQFARDHRRLLGLFRKIRAQARVAAARDGRGAAHAAVDFRVPVGNIAFLRQRQFHHGTRGRGHVMQAPHADARDEHGKQQDHGKTQAEAHTNTDVS
ncbi:hypothetical protein D3C85_1148230 [compost metagenome]